jgi:hypothetical protein
MLKVDRENTVVDVTMNVPEELAQRLQPLQNWLPTIIELGLVGFRTPATETATEIIKFLSTDPSPEEVVAYHASARSQARLQRLLALNEAGMLGEAETRELDELQQIEHIFILLKADLARCQ